MPFSSGLYRRVVGLSDVLSFGMTPSSFPKPGVSNFPSAVQRTDYAAGVLVASRACDIAAVQAAADALKPAP